MTSTEPPPGRLQYQRQRDIYGLALRHGSVDVSALAKRFHVTTETIRRDLTELQDRLLLRRVHGGAVPYERRDHEPMVDARGMLHADEKLRIGRETYTPIGMKGWYQAIFKRDSDGRERVLTIDQLLERMDSWER